VVFSPANRRFSLLVIAAVAVARSSPPPSSFWRSSTTGPATRPAKTRHDLKDKIDTVPAVANAVLDKVDELDKKTNGHLAESIRVVADEIRKAERDQVLTDPRMVAAVRVLVTNVVREVCAEREKDK
jgi:hypothetical protein